MLSLKRSQLFATTGLALALAGCSVPKSPSVEQTPEAVATQISKLNSLTPEQAGLGEISFDRKTIEIKFDTPKFPAKIGDLESLEHTVDAKRTTWLGSDEEFDKYRDQNPMTEADEIKVGGSFLGTFWKIQTSKGPMTIFIPSMNENLEPSAVNSAFESNKGITRLKGTYTSISLEDRRPIVDANGYGYFTQDKVWALTPTEADAFVERTISDGKK